MNQPPKKSSVGLRNPEVTDRGGPTPSVDPDKFQTHIPEPHWQRVLIIIAIVLVVILWLWASQSNLIN